jgi:hypothetical protein
MKSNCQTVNFLIFSFVLSAVFASRTQLKDPTNDEKVLHRQKRFLIFPGGGTAKFVGEI